jgi:hypothetical protein
MNFARVYKLTSFTFSLDSLEMIIHNFHLKHSLNTKYTNEAGCCAL